MSAIVKFSLNNWTAGKDYPEDLPFTIEYSGPLFDDNYCKNNKLCVNMGMVDMSCNLTVVAPLEWVKKECKCILGSKFQFDEKAEYDHFGLEFLEYTKENYGFHYVEDFDW